MTITKWFVITVETAYLFVHLCHIMCVYSASKVSWFVKSILTCLLPGPDGTIVYMSLTSIGHCLILDVLSTKSWIPVLKL